MRKKINSIPVHSIADNFGGAIAIDRISLNDPGTLDKEMMNMFEEAQHSHREDRHSFFLIERGTVQIEIDFQQYYIQPSTVIYMHPNQIHRIIAFNDVIVSNWSIDNENLNPEYLKLLEDITPAKPLILPHDRFITISGAVSLFMQFPERKNDNLYESLLKDSCNVLVALVVSQYLEGAIRTGRAQRFAKVYRTFRQLLEHNYTFLKSPAAYAQKLNISPHYLNECVKNTTGYSVSHEIHERIILEAKRLLHHSEKSIKEIATELGYDDYPYFSRLFTKVSGMTALKFRNKNHE